MFRSSVIDLRVNNQQLFIFLKYNAFSVKRFPYLFYLRRHRQRLNLLLSDGSRTRGSAFSGSFLSFFLPWRQSTSMLRKSRVWKDKPWRLFGYSLLIASRFCFSSYDPLFHHHHHHHRFKSLNLKKKFYFPSSCSGINGTIIYCFREMKKKKHQPRATQFPSSFLLLAWLTPYDSNIEPLNHRSRPRHTFF